MQAMKDGQVRRAAVLRAQEEIKCRPVYLDTETTGLDKADQIVDICVVDDDGNVLVDSLVKPKGPIPLEVIRIHGITDEMVQDAPTWPAIWPQVEAALAGRRVAIYNAEFDVRLMKQSHRACRLPWRQTDLNAFCIMQLYAQFHGEWDFPGQSLAEDEHAILEHQVSDDLRHRLPARDEDQKPK